MLLLPLILVKTVKGDAGMLVALILLFAVNPVLSVIMGILSGRQVSTFWFMPIILAVLFWAFSSLTYQTAFPIVYSVIYFVICLFSMLLTAFFTLKGRANSGG